MTELRAEIRLRPTRIGFLVRPSDKKSLRKIMRINTCLWGGLYNPIIPIYTRTPKEWEDEHFFTKKGKDVAQGYVKFFDPDVYVEAEEGLLEKAGLGAFRADRIERKVILLDEFFEREYRGLHEPKFGQSVYDILDDVYVSERRFQLRDESPAVYSSNEDLFSEACVGCYPEEEHVSYLKKYYNDVYRPDEVSPNPQLWLKLYGDRCETPLSVTSKHFEVLRTWQDDPVIYIFDPSNSKDIIDLWNLRIQPAPIYPVPIKWLPELAESLGNFIKSNHRPLKGNNHGVMHRVTIEKSRSISEEDAKKTILPHFTDLPKGSYSMKYWRTRIWDVDYKDHFIQHPERAIVTADKSDETIQLKDDSLYGTFNTLAPKFSEQYSSSRNRWANVVQISSPYEGTNVALSLPFNTLDRSWPFSHMGEFACGREGWVFLQDYKSTNEYIKFIKHEDAFSSWFELYNLKTQWSEPGRIARQMLQSLNGFWGLYLVDDKESIQFINKHASSTRIRTNDDSGEVLEEDFSGRSASIDDWQAMIQRRKAAGSHHMVELGHYIDRNVIKVGLETECDHCGAKNWHGLDDASYNLRCLRCLKEYKFPQGNIKKHNNNWRYRVIGPFAVPDYAQGAYASLLTIRFFTRNAGRDVPCSYSTALELEGGNQKKSEIDFAIWVPEERGIDISGAPRLIIGEAKSFGEKIIKDDDLEKLRKSASVIPDSIIAISVLKDSFSKEEKQRLKDFVLWAREPVDYRPRHWVILLTGTELFNEFLETTWKDMGEPYSTYANYHSTNYIESLSDATQSIYLGFESYHQWLEKKNNEK
jgi:hypothetical protein